MEHVFWFPLTWPNPEVWVSMCWLISVHGEKTEIWYKINGFLNFCIAKIQTVSQLEFFSIYCHQFLQMYMYMNVNCNTYNVLIYLHVQIYYLRFLNTVQVQRSIKYHTQSERLAPLILQAWYSAAKTFPWKQVGGLWEPLKAGGQRWSPLMLKTFQYLQLNCKHLNFYSNDIWSGFYSHSQHVFFCLFPCSKKFDFPWFQWDCWKVSCLYYAFAHTHTHIYYTWPLTYTFLNQSPCMHTHIYIRCNYYTWHTHIP